MDSKSIASASAVEQVLGRNGKDSLDIRIKKSSYQGAINEDTPDQTRQYDRSDVLKAFKELITKILNKDEQYSEKLKDFQSKRSAASVAVRQVLGRNALDGRNVVIKKSSYEGAINEDTPDQTRQYDRSDVLKAFKESITKILNKDEQYSEKLKDFQSKRSAASVAVRQVLGRNALDGENVIIRKSSYQGATNEGTADQTRQYDRSDVLKAFKESITKIENLA